jgi:pyruvate kinase
MTKRTKIVCTIGPASNSLPVLKKMIKAGMNVARLNFSHGTYEQHSKLIKLIRQASKELGVIVSILQDLQGPRIRLGELPEKGIEVKNGEKLIFTTDSKPGSGKIPVTYNRLHNEVAKGHRILIADGIYEFLVEKVKGKDIITKVINGGKLTSHKGMNFPDTNLSISSLSEKDLSDLDFGVQQRVDFVALSFVRSAKDVSELHNKIVHLEHKYKIKDHVLPKIVVKIEKPDAITNFDSILDLADAVMVARGDLGIELLALRFPMWLMLSLIALTLLCFPVSRLWVSIRCRLWN